MSDVSPSSRTDDWTATVLDKLRQVGQVATKVGAQAVLDGGDFFHIKSPSRNSHDLVRRVAELHRTAYPCPVYANVGNHDCVYGDYSFIDQQPLGVLFATGVFRRLYDEHEVVFTTEDEDADPVKVRVVGVPYHGTSYDMERFRSIRKGDEDFLVCVAHVLASPKGGTMFEGEDIIKYSELLDFDPDLFLFGHWHKDQGVTEVGGKTIVNIGSLTRGSLSQDEMDRKPACAVLTFEKGKPVQVNVVRLKVKPAAEVFDVEGRQRAETRSLTMDSFVQSVQERLVLDTSQSLTDVVSNMDVPQTIKERVLLYLERAEAE
jgi:DNA repair exonuclease SbcCD nuclease subunit